MARLSRIRYLVVAVCSALAFATFGCAVPTETGVRAGAGVVPAGFQPRDVEFYQNTLHQVPLRLASNFQDLSRVLSIRESNARMTELHYFYHNGVRDLYAVFNNNHVYRLNALDFALDWTADLEYQPAGDPVAHGDSVFFHLDGPRVREYWREGQHSGRQLRQERFLQQTVTSPIAANSGGFYFGVAQNFRVYGWRHDNPDSAQWHWQGMAAHSRVSQPIYADINQAYFYSESGHLVSVDTQNGSQNWIYPYDEATIRLLAPMRVKYDIFWFGDTTGTLYAMDKSSRVFFQFQGGEPIVSTPYVQDYYVIYQTPTSLAAIRPTYVDAGDGQRFLRASEHGEDASEPLWTYPLVPEQLASSFRNMRTSMRDVLESRERRNIRVLMKGRNWLYLLETTRQGRKYLFRIDAASGEVDGEIDPDTNELRPRRVDVSAFPYILANDDEENRTIYFGTFEGYMFAMRE